MRIVAGDRPLADATDQDPRCVGWPRRCSHAKIEFATGAQRENRLGIEPAKYGIEPRKPGGSNGMPGFWFHRSRDSSGSRNSTPTPPPDSRPNQSGNRPTRHHRSRCSVGPILVPPWCRTPLFRVVRLRRIELRTPAWKAEVLPLNYSRDRRRNESRLTSGVKLESSRRVGDPPSPGFGGLRNALHPALQKVGRELRQFRALALGQLDVSGNGLAFHAVMAVDQAVASGIDVGIVDLGRVADQDDFRAFGDAGDDGFSLRAASTVAPRRG